MTGGGTGGHVNPAIAIAETIKLNIPGSVIAFVGTPRGIENKLVKAAGYELYHVDVRGLRRSLSFANFKAAYLALTSPGQAKKIIQNFKPDIVIGTGGYVSWPVLRAAASLGIPSMIHESNAYPGVTTRMLARHIDTILLNFEKTAEYLKPLRPKKMVLVGNPLRSGFFASSAKTASASVSVSDAKEGYQKMILSYGGSLGAQHINEAVLAMMRDYTKHHPEILHILAAGSIEWEDANKMFDDYGLRGYPNLRLVEYIYDMPHRMAAADLIICRAGAMTVSEIAAMRRAAIFIPSPNVTENHQYKNARVLEEAGAAVIIEEKDLTGESLTAVVDALLRDDKRRRAMGDAAGAFAIEDANKRIFKEICALTGYKKL